MNPSKLETLVQIDEDTNCALVVQRLLTNNVDEAKHYIATFDSLVCEVEVEEDYNDNYKYCVSIYIQNDIITDLI